MTSQEKRVVGKRGLRRIDAYEKATGKAVYTRDIILPGMLYARVLTCPYPHARIVRMDTSKAEEYPGVRAVLRYDDPDIEGKVLPGSYSAPWVVLSNVGRWEGEPVGTVIAAESEQICNEALQLVEIEWEELPFVLDELHALQFDTPVFSIREQELEGNPFRLVRRYSYEQGNIQKGFQEAERIIEFEARRRYHTWIGAEMPSGICRWNGEYPEIWVNHQHPYEHKQGMEKWFGIPMNKITVHSPYQGGSFGGWSWMSWTPLIHYLIAILAKRTNRPVKIVFNRRENFYGGSLDAGVYCFKVGFKQDGTITAVQLKNVFANSPPGYQPESGIQHFIENTKIPNLAVENKGVFVNKGPVNAVRSEQLPNTLCINLVFGHVAAELGMDPTEVAILNDGCEGHDVSYINEYKKKHGFPNRDSLREVIGAGKRAISWDEKWHPPATKKLPNGKMHGLGFIWTHNWNSKRGAGYAGVLIHTDGTVSLLAQRADVGVSAETAYCQILAEELGMRYEDVIQRQQHDVGFVMMTPDGSCNLCSNGWTVKMAAQKAKRRLLELATTTVQPFSAKEPIETFAGFQPEDLDIEDSEIYLKEDPSRRLNVKEVVREDQCVQYTTHPPIIDWAWFSLTRGQPELGERPRLCRQAHFMEVEVDTETGEIDITRIVNVNDVGKAINPEAVEGQQYGGMYMALSRSLCEEVIWDEVTGVMLNGNLVDYKIATIRESGQIETIIVESEMGYGPYGANGIGEDVADHAASLLGLAVHNAIGVWIDDLPITPDKVLMALGKI
jgi:CO/xanthine dehydrogenase Mo-binding subunit